MVVCYDNFPDSPELAVFNTLVPQDHPRNLRRFRLPPKYLLRSARVHLDRDRSLGTVNRDGPLIVDPTQAILIMDLSPNVPEPRIFLILRMQPLIEHACSMRADVQIPWDEWGRDAVAMEIPMDSTYFTTITHGARVLAIRNTRHGPEERYLIHTFDFSRRGSAALPLSDENDGGTERRALFKDGRSCVFGGGDGMIPWGLQSLGDSIMFYVVSLPSSSTIEGAVC